MDTTTTAAIPTQLTLTLLKPVSFGSTTVTELKLSEPTLKQLREASRAGELGLDRVAKLIELNAVVLPAVVDQLGQRDLGRVNDFFAGFDRPSTD
jgi:hypothetical protein